jgi:hypothetical protein
LGEGLSSTVNWWAERLRDSSHNGACR